MVLLRFSKQRQKKPNIFGIIFVYKHLLALYNLTRELEAPIPPNENVNVDVDVDVIYDQLKELREQSDSDELN